MRFGMNDSVLQPHRLDRCWIAMAATDALSADMAIPSCNSAARRPSTRCGLLCSAYEQREDKNNSLDLHHHFSAPQISI